MTKKTKKIFLKESNQWVVVPDELFKESFRDINSYRRKQQRHGCCTCPHDKWWLCDENCEECEFQRVGDRISLEAEIGINDNTISLEETIPDQTINIEEAFCEVELLDALRHELLLLSSEDSKICQLMMEDKTMRERARLLGLPLSTYVGRWEKIKERLYDRLKDYL